MSWQLRLMAAQQRLVLKPLLARSTGPMGARWGLDFLAQLVFRQPPLMRHYLRDSNLHWFACGPCQPGKVILYFHGGGFVAGSPMTHAGMLGRLSQISGLEICAPLYRLAPESPAPAAFDDCLSAWDRLIDQGFDPSDIVIGGDSAGGGLALSVLSELCTRATPPAGVFALCPVVDFTMQSESLQRNAHSEALLPAELFQTLADIVLDGFKADDPRVSPIFGDFPGCCPVLFQYSDSEILQDDTLRMAEHLREFSAPVALEVEPGAPHVWQLLDGWLPEARASLRRIATFAQTSLAVTKR